jgi:hypothetical protein
VTATAAGGRWNATPWWSAAWAAPGEQLAPLVASSGLFGGLPAGHMAAIDRVAFPAYLDGLRAAGYGSPTAPRLRFAFASRRPHGWSAASTQTGPAPTWAGCATQQRALFESFFGRPFAEVHQQITATFRFLATCVGAEAFELLPRINVS